jgi:hypothetical protein
MLLIKIEVMIDDEDILDHVVQFNIINVIIVQNQNQDHHHQSKIKKFGLRNLIIILKTTS